MYCVYVSAAFSLLRVHDFKIVAHNYEILSHVINYEFFHVAEMGFHTFACLEETETVT